MMTRGRKKKVVEVLPVTARAGGRFCYSEDGVYSNDGLFRWWMEYDNSGYNWDGHFDIITKDQVRERIEFCDKLGIVVREKITYGAGEEKDLYFPVDMSRLR